MFITQFSLSVSACEQTRPRGFPRALTHNPPSCCGFIEVIGMAQVLFTLEHKVGLWRSALLY